MLRDEEESQAQMRLELEQMRNEERGRSPSTPHSSTSDDMYDDLIFLLKIRAAD